MPEFGILHPDGRYVRQGTLSQAAIRRCPHLIIDIAHYREDGSCRCDDPVEQERLIREYGYTSGDFPDRAA